MPRGGLEQQTLPRLEGEAEKNEVAAKIEAYLAKQAEKKARWEEKEREAEREKANAKRKAESEKANAKRKEDEFVRQQILSRKGQRALAQWEAERIVQEAERAKAKAEKEERAKAKPEKEERAKAKAERAKAEPGKEERAKEEKAEAKKEKELLKSLQQKCRSDLTYNPSGAEVILVQRLNAAKMEELGLASLTPEQMDAAKAVVTEWDDSTAYCWRADFNAAVRRCFDLNMEPRQIYYSVLLGGYPNRPCCGSRLNDPLLGKIAGAVGNVKQQMDSEQWVGHCIKFNAAPVEVPLEKTMEVTELLIRATATEDEDIKQTMAEARAEMEMERRHYERRHYGLL